MNNAHWMRKTDGEFVISLADDAGDLNYGYGTSLPDAIRDLADAMEEAQQPETYGHLRQG